MRRRIIGSLCAVCIGLGLLGAAASAPGLDVLDQRREQVRALSVELSRIDSQTAAAADEHARAGARLEDLRTRIARNGAVSRRALVAHERASARLERRLVALYTRPDPGPVELLLAAGNLRDAVAVHDLQRRAGRRDGVLVGDLRASRERLRTTRRLLTRERAEAAVVRTQAARRLADMEDLLERRRLVLGRAEAALAGVIARRERAAALARAQATAEAQARRRARAAPGPVATAPAAAPDPPPDAGPSTPEPARGADGPLRGGPSYTVLARIAQCESGGNPRAVSASGQYRGKYQFDRPTWASVGGSGDPAEASPAEQDLRAAMLYMRRGPAPWPICGYR